MLQEEWAYLLTLMCWHLGLLTPVTLPHTPSQGFVCAHAARGSHAPAVPPHVSALVLAPAEWWQRQAPRRSWVRVKHSETLGFRNAGVCSLPQALRLCARGGKTGPFCGHGSFVLQCDCGVHGPPCALQASWLSEGAYVGVPARLHLESLRGRTREMENA